MSRYIDADALIAELQKDEERFDKEAEDCRKNSRNYTDCYIQAMSSRADGIRDAIVEVYDAPSIEPKHGEWKLFYESKDGDNVYKCSCCRFITVIPEGIKLFSFCPNCGADMRGKNDD